MKVDGMEIKEILEFPPTPGFGKWRKYFPEDAIAHPAKMNLNLLEYLVLTYTNEGDTVLDPMAGTGSTGVMCALKGRNCIQVELEERFFRWMEQARENVEKTPLLTKKGKIVNICGDARRLSELLKEHEEEIRCVLFSPPYANAKHHYKHGLKELGDNFKGRKAWEEKKEEKTSEENIENLPFEEEGIRRQLDDEQRKTPQGEVDSVIFSPPYGNAISKQGGPCGISEVGISCKTVREYSGDVKNIGNLPMEENVDNIIFSPPYSSISLQSNRKLLERIGRDYEEGQPRKGQRIISKNVILRYKDYNPNNPSNIGNLPHGEIDHIIFSPPFGQAQKGGGIAQKGYDGQYGRDERLHLRHDRPLSDRKDNISNLPFSSVDVVLTSPPYSESIQTRTDEEKRLKRLEEKGFLDKKEWQRPHTIRTPGRRAMFSENAYSDNNGNIGNLKHGEIDTILTSPPYESSLEGTSRHTRGGIASRDKKLAQTGSLTMISEDTKKYEELANCIITSPPYEESMGDKHHSPRGDEIVREKEHYNTYTETKKKDNIGNLRKETYLSAMLTVYEQCYLVLKRGGKMIIVIKDFVRNFQVVKLHEHTIKLCELAGFVLKEVLLFKLPQQSFWRILYKKKHGSKVKNLDLLDYEWVLIFEKP